MGYEVRIKPSALKALEKLPASVRERVRVKIRALAENPRPHGSEKLAGDDNAHRLRVGDHRVLYEVHDDILFVMVVRVAHRREACR
ncbi:type II toxin-antitoxin system RelE/ParE family toxin [Candidatus Sumerlaeota bacterium]|nr:type II toxin-antitoxin system RelE/ParE family toxin [Candidatus Sumerlaeota bacterium]